MPRPLEVEQALGRSAASARQPGEAAWDEIQRWMQVTLEQHRNEIAGNMNAHLEQFGKQLAGKADEHQAVIRNLTSSAMSDRMQSSQGFSVNRRPAWGSPRLQQFLSGWSFSSGVGGPEPQPFMPPPLEHKAISSQGREEYDGRIPRKLGDALPPKDCDVLGDDVGRDVVCAWCFQEGARMACPHCSSEYYCCLEHLHMHSSYHAASCAGRTSNHGNRQKKDLGDYASGDQNSVGRPRQRVTFSGLPEDKEPSQAFPSSSLASLAQAAQTAEHELQEAVVDSPGQGQDALTLWKSQSGDSSGAGAFQESNGTGSRSSLNLRRSSTASKKGLLQKFEAREKKSCLQEFALGPLDWYMGVVVAINIVIMIVQTMEYGAANDASLGWGTPWPENSAEVFLYFEFFFWLIYMFDLFFRLAVLRKEAIYEPTDGWNYMNIFDAFLVLLNTLELIVVPLLMADGNQGSSSIVKVLKLLRLTKAFRIVRTVNRIVVL
eukprot:TRINITY_DN36838_c0_g1_i2.p1 TRINITY_DN36838_c0_g1~~TRINITY_DN36838_c0_g1_i2.p1  ORF type:complete len:498 (-),score=98.36 TRINITY_DN36838_c0_g1_i2:67-1536(-)